MAKWNKYKAKKVEINGEVFDSKKEANRYQELLLLQRAGKIRDLQRQVKFELIPAQYEESVTYTKTGEEKIEELTIDNFLDDFKL